MTEYDAFGNPIEPARSSSAPARPPDEPPPTTPASTAPQPAGPTSTPAAPQPAVPAPPSAAPPTPAPLVPTYVAPRRSRGGLGCLVLLLLTVGLPVAVAAVIVLQVSDTVDSVTRQISTSLGATTTPSSAEAAPPDGLSARSLLRRENFARGVGEIRRAAGGGRLVSIRVEAGRIDAQVAQPGGRVWLIDRPWDGAARILAKPPGASTTPTLAWSQVNPAAPQRLAATVRGGSTRPSRQLNYAVLLGATGTWSAFSVSGTLYTAGLSGHGAQRAG